jgi:hypothetical protein
VGNAAVKPAVLLHHALRSGVHELGRVGGLGLALLAGAAAFHFSAVQPAQEAAAELQWRRTQLAKRADNPAPASAAAAPGAAQIDRFMGFFPSLDSTPDWLRTLYAVAERERLELLQGSYRLSEDRVLNLAQYRITLPVRGSYPQIRRFIGGALDEIPALSLENVVFQREKIGDGAVEAKIGLTLHLRSAPPPAPKPALALGAS